MKARLWSGPFDGQVVNVAKNSTTFDQSERIPGIGDVWGRYVREHGPVLTDELPVFRCVESGRLAPNFPAQ